jgi:hypothetical protein
MKNFSAKKSSFFKLLFAVILTSFSLCNSFAQSCAGGCPQGYTVFLCGRCWTDIAQARSGGCTENCPATGTVPAAPSNLTATAASSSQINLAWTDNSSNETGFLVERSTGTGAFAQIASLGAGVTSYNNTGLAASTTYNYRVRATNATGNSAYSATVTRATTAATTTAPAAPSNLTTTVASNTQINLAWTDNSNNETSFLVERSTGTGAFAQIASVGAGVTSYSSTGLTANTSYNFRVRANNAVGNSAYSNTSTKTTTNTTTTSISGKFTPPAGKTMMIVGQDLAAVTGYTSAANGFPVPAGVTTYLAFYILRNPAIGTPSGTIFYGSLGLDNSNNPQTTAGGFDSNWGAGPLNAYSSALGWPNSTLQIGLSMVEDATNNLSQIISGAKDADIIKLRDFCAKVGTVSKKPIYIRIGYEFDGTWNTGYGNRANYIAAYQRIVNVMRGGTNGTGSLSPNVAFVWQACTSPVDDILENGPENISDWYPGDNYVDWMGLSWFLTAGNSPATSTPATQISLANEVLALARSKSKPVMIAESTPQGYNLTSLTKGNVGTWDGTPHANIVSKTASQIWTEWFTPYFNYIYANSDVIRAASYINTNWDADAIWGAPYNSGYWGDTRVQANATIKANWTTELAKPIWIHGSTTLFNSLGAPGARLASEENSVDAFEVNFFPNPNSKGMLYTDGLKVGMEYQITDMLGLPKVTKEVTTDNESINISAFKTGTYIINVIDNQKKIAKKIVVE